MHTENYCHGCDKKKKEKDEAIGRSPSGQQLLIGRNPKKILSFQKFIITHVAQLSAAPKVLTFLKSVQYIQSYHLLKYPVNPTLFALHFWDSAGKQG